jgi:hypothetical protein
MRKKNSIVADARLPRDLQVSISEVIVFRASPPYQREVDEMSPSPESVKRVE